MKRERRRAVDADHAARLRHTPHTSSASRAAGGRVLYAQLENLQFLYSLAFILVSISWEFAPFIFGEDQLQERVKRLPLLKDLKKARIVRLKNLGGLNGPVSFHYGCKSEIRLFFSENVVNA